MNDFQPLVIATSKDLAQVIDHTLLRPEATEDELTKLCVEARECGFKTVCVLAKWLPLAAQLLKGTGTVPITVIAFPSGEGSAQEKANETSAAVSNGAKEIDVVLNRTWLKEKTYSKTLEELSAVVKAANGLPVKVILETSELTDDEKKIACVLAKIAGVSFVKTSTGFSKGGATEADVRLMREVVGRTLGVKASGGIRDYETAMKMIRAGATRLGTSASVAIVGGVKADAGGY